jgi:hypothetical protein
MKVRVHEHHPADPGQIFDTTLSSLPRVGEFIRFAATESGTRKSSSIDLWRVEAIVHEAATAPVDAILFVSKTDEHSIIDLFERGSDE